MKAELAAVSRGLVNCALGIKFQKGFVRIVSVNMWPLSKSGVIGLIRGGMHNEGVN